MNKTVPTAIAPSAFIDQIEHEVRQADARVLLEFLERISGFKPKMWGASLIGYGAYHYKYESGREGDSCRIGFSPRNANLVVYIMPGYSDFSKQLSKLGKHKLGKSCLYINKLADVDMAILEEICIQSLDIMAEKYPL